MAYLLVARTIQSAFHGARKADAAVLHTRCSKMIDSPPRVAFNRRVKNKIRAA